MYNSPIIEKKVLELYHECIDLYKNHDINGAFNKLESAWNVLPEPKVYQSMSYFILERFFELCMLTKKYELANKWINLIFIASPNRLDDGEREFIAGKLAYEQGNFEVAKELLFIANVKSKGVIFKGNKNKYYRELIK